jgi:hypothetical protein
MFIAYYDESGDDGFPRYSSPLFVLSALYLHFQDWKKTYQEIQTFRRKLKEDFGLPVTFEFHTRRFILNKEPYRGLKIHDDDRLRMITLFCEFTAKLRVRIINVVIDKKKIKAPSYAVLDTALTYSIQRVENDLEQVDPLTKFMIITDSGRVGKMRKTSRKIQRINYIPSKFSSVPYNREIKLLIEDPLPKDSKESYFIQLSDLVAHVVYLYSFNRHKGRQFPNRFPKGLDQAKVEEWMTKLKPSFNLKATATNQFGVVYHPR